MEAFAYKPSRAKIAAKRYREISQFIEFANLLPSEVRNGELGISFVRHYWDRSASKREWIRDEQLHRLVETLPENQGNFDLRQPRSEAGQLLLDLITDLDARFRKRLPKGIRVVRADGTEDIWGGEPESEDDVDILSELLNLFRYFIATRATFARLADEFSRKWTPGRSRLVAIPLRAPLQVPFVANRDAQSAKLYAAPDLIWDGLRRLLEGQDAQTFKRCPVCFKFFIAWRKDKGACSSRCLQTNRVRRFRSRSREYEYHRKLKAAGLAP